MVTCYHQECLHPWRIQFACLQPARLEVTNTNQRMAEVCWPKLAIIHFIPTISPQTCEQLVQPTSSRLWLPAGKPRATLFVCLPQAQTVDHGVSRHTDSAFPFFEGLVERYWYHRIRERPPWPWFPSLQPFSCQLCFSIITASL